MDHEALMKSIRALLLDMRTMKWELMEALIDMPTADCDSTKFFTYSMRVEAEDLISSGDYLMRYWLDTMESERSVLDDIKRYQAGIFSLDTDDDVDDYVLEPPISYANSKEEHYYRQELTRDLLETIERLDRNRKELIKILMYLRSRRK